MTDPAAVPSPAADDPPAVAVPYLLLMPSGEGTPQTVVWPGAEGQPAWAIPVTIPAGTPGFAVFVPLVPGATVPVQRPGTPAVQVTAGANTTAAPPAAAAEVDTSSGGPAPTGVAEDPAPRSTVDDAETSRPGVIKPVPTPAGPTRTPSAPPGPPQHPFSGPHPGAPHAAPGGYPPAMPGAGPVAAGGFPPRVPGGFPAGGYPMPYPRPVVPRPPGFLRTRWPGPDLTRGWRVPVAVLVGALAASIFLPGMRVGVGWFLGGLALVVAVAVGVWPAAAAQSRAVRSTRVVWAVSALALLSVLAFRNAWWLVTFCVLGALGCAALAIVGGRVVRTILYSLVAAPFAAFRGIPWVARHLSGLTVDRAGEPRAVRRAVWTVVITTVLLIVFGVLLSSADAAFSEVLASLVPHNGIDVGQILLFLVCALIAVAAVYTISAPPDLSTMERSGTARFRRMEWGLPIGALVVLFGVFVGVQFTVLFGGKHHVLETAGLSYAAYARSGFWQLVAVTVLTIGVLGGVTRWARRENPGDRVLLRSLLGPLCALTIVIVVSALYRMYTYQKVYSFTGERIFVMSFELLLGTVLLMIMLAGVRWRGAWIPSATVGLAVVLLLSLAILNPEDYAARRNIERYQETGKIDAWYLRALSSDATPALSALPDAVRRCTLSWIAGDLDKADPWYGWNLDRERARDALRRVGGDAIGGSGDCRAADQFDLPKTR